MVLDERYVEQALQEYREATADYSIFQDLPSELQSAILRRGQQLKDADQEKGAAVNPVAIRPQSWPRPSGSRLSQKACFRSRCVFLWRPTWKGW